MRIVMFSDTHGHFDIEIPDGDVLIFAGDLGRTGTILELAEFNKKLGDLPHKHKIVIAGNHDFMFDEHKDLSKNLLTNAVYLEHQSYQIDDIKIFASPYHPKIWGKFELEREELYPLWDMIPNDTEILITHGPPYGIRDRSVRGHKSVGDKALKDATNRVRPEAHIFGHIHEGYGHSQFMNTHFFNVSICNEKDEPVNKPIVWDY